MRVPMLDPAPAPAPPSLQTIYTDRYARLVERARVDMDAFGTVVLKDQDGAPLDIAAFHRVMTRFVNWCWYPELRPDEEERSLPPYYCGILAPWRHGKTTLGPIRIPLFRIGVNPNIRIRLVCADDREAMLRVSSVRRYLLSEEYKYVFPKVKPARLADWTKHQFFVSRDSLGQDPTLAAAGVFNTEAGGGSDIMMFDDIATYQNMILRPAYRARVYETLTSVWLRRIDPNTRVVYVGTTWHADDPPHLFRAQKDSQWRWLIVGVSEGFDRLSCRIE